MIGIIAIKQSVPLFTRYGYLYNGHVINNGSSLIYGYHIPTLTEINILIDYLSQTSIPSDSLRQSGGNSWGFPNYATNSSGFNALAGGYRNHLGDYTDINYQSLLWTSTVGGISEIYYCLGILSNDITYPNYHYLYGLSIRLIKDDPDTWSPNDTATDYDNNIYDTVKIGTQVWLTSDLKTTKFMNGTPINHVPSAPEWGILSTSGYCIYNEIDTSKPTITTDRILNITLNSAKCLNTLVSFGANMTERGVCWNTTTNPTIYHNKNTGNFNILGQITTNIINLTKNTLYYVRSYVKTTTDVVYGKELLLKTYNDIVHDVEGNDYYTVIVGDNEWMATNFRCKKFNDGIREITPVGPAEDWITIAEAAWCDYDNNDGGGSPDFPIRRTHGILYNGYVTASKNVITNDQTSLLDIAPINWHVASAADWASLSSLTNNDSKQIMEYGNFNWNNNTNGVYNKTGLGFVGTGWRGVDGVFYQYKNQSYYWDYKTLPTSSPYTYMFCEKIDVSKQWIANTYEMIANGFSIRCVKNIYPVINTIQIFDINDTNASCEYNFISEGSYPILEIGICYGYSSSPTINNYKQISDNINFGQHYSTFNNFLDNHLIYVRSYVISTLDTYYGNEISFTSKWAKDQKAFGYLYNLSAALKLAPPGWHLPTKQEFDTLALYADNNIKNLAESGGGNWIEQNQNNIFTNSTNFTALPSGEMQPNNNALPDFKYIQKVTIFWSATFYNGEDAYVASYNQNYNLVTTDWRRNYDARMYVLLLSNILIGARTTDVFNTFGFHGYDAYPVRLIKNDSTNPGSVLINGVNYETVKIGNQVWTKTNLYSTTTNNGEPIQNIQNFNDWYNISTSENHPPLYSYYPTTYSKNILYG